MMVDMYMFFHQAAKIRAEIDFSKSFFQRQIYWLEGTEALFLAHA